MVLHVENYPPQNDSQILACYLHRAVCGFFFEQWGVCVSLSENLIQVDELRMSQSQETSLRVRACVHASHR